MKRWLELLKGSILAGGGFGTKPHANLQPYLPLLLLSMASIFCRYDKPEPLAYRYKVK